MRLAYLQKFSLLDYPERIACVVFLNGCNFRCPYCYNASIVLKRRDEIDESEFFAFLDERKDKVEAVVVTGGEPTLYPDLPEFIRLIKRKGFLVKLDTNGSKPNVIRELAESQDVDYFALDIKAWFDDYDKATGVSGFGDRVKETAAILMKSNVEYEFRTTLVKPFLSNAGFVKIIGFIKGSKAYYLQRFDSGKELISAEGLSGFSREENEELLKLAKASLPGTIVKLRGFY
ncbi:MAG TPA: anaerobic ribonucleoside-triphosphate reductase activating protein [Candidatus Woesearchaeota archaeon]|nr:anaerobic ribonucleoside-triphosphate reductase activating protein [Candidatus Woesearchaeota archaeon]